MTIPYLHSIQEVSITYNTGDMPVQVLCADKQQYICKYMRPNATIAYKLVCELIGATFAEAWKINTPPCAIVHICPEHWATVTVPHNSFAPAIGFKKIDGVIDITPTSFRQTSATRQTLYQLLKIALFDFWLANEDRTCNNANLLYDIDNDEFISIDYGGVLNNVTFDFPLSPLTETDSILCADVFAHIVRAVSDKQLSNLVQQLERYYRSCLKNSQEQQDIITQLPKDWNIPTNKITNKINELFSAEWTDAVWHNFVECLKSNSNYGK